jgi:DNA-binding transcriptional LysR family regulator
MTDVLSIDQLRSFVVIAETGNYTRAAERLYRTQPALSLQIKRLEEQLGTRLLDRNGRETTVTEAGQVLLAYARRILDLNEEAFSKLSVVETEGSVRVGVLEEVALGPLVDLLTKFGRLCTRIEIELQVATSWELAERIEANDLCLAVANSTYARLPVVPLWQETYVWAANPDYNLLDENPLPLVVDPLSYPCYLRDTALATLDRERRPWVVAFSSTSLTALKAAVRAGLGIGLLAEEALTPEMVVLGPNDGLPAIAPAEIALYRGTDATSEAVNCLADFLKTHLRDTTMPAGFS